MKPTAPKAPAALSAKELRYISKQAKLCALFDEYANKVFPVLRAMDRHRLCQTEETETEVLLRHADLYELSWELHAQLSACFKQTPIKQKRPPRRFVNLYRV